MRSITASSPIRMSAATASRAPGFGSSATATSPAKSPSTATYIGVFLSAAGKRVAYAAGCVPAARGHAADVASRRTPQRAGMLPGARIVRGGLVA